MDYDAQAGTLTAENEFFLVDNSQYYFDSYRNAVFTKYVAPLETPWEGAQVGEGDFYLYNPESGLWLQNNDKNTGDWNTRGATGDYGFEFGISAIDGGYKLDPKFGHNHSMNISNFYLDTQSDVSAWKLEKLNTNEGVIAYQIKADDGRVLSLNNDNNLDWNTGRAAEWQLVTKADRIKFM